MKRNSRTLIAAAALLSLSACGPSGEEPLTLRYGLTLAPTGIDPHLNASSELGIPLSSVYDTLVYLDPETGDFVPGLAQSWEISGDGRTYTFHLRNDVTFHDGTPFNAQAVLANIGYTLDPDHHSQRAAAMLGEFESTEVIDDHTVALHLREPFAPLLDSLSQVYLGIASPSALETWGPTEYQFHQVGTGPYRFVEYVPNDHLTLARNPDYDWGPSVYRAERAQVETIVFTFYVDEATRALALQSGEVDVIGEIPPRDADRLANAGGFNLAAVPIPGQPMQYFLNTHRAPTDDALVRRALIQAIDREAVVRTVFGEHSPVARGILAAATPGAPLETPLPPYDPTAARALLDQAGWVDEDGDGMRSRDGVPLGFLVIAPNWGSNPDVAQLLKAAWEEMGATVTLEVAAGFGPLREAQSTGEYNVIGYNSFGTDADLLRMFFESDALFNWSGVSDPEIDSILAEAAALPLDPEARSALYERLAERVLDQALVLPLRDYVDLVVSSDRVQDLRFSAQGWFPQLIDLRLKP
jgi:peptide/nickel transport system substrate-binding protein